MPWASRKLPLELTQTPLRRADQIARPALAHLGQVLLRRDAAVHDPDPLRFPVARLDPLEKPRQRRAVGCVPGQHLIGQRKTLRRHDQRDHHLHAVAAVIAAVAVAALVFFRKRRIALKVRARQVIQQHIEQSGASCESQVRAAVAGKIEREEFDASGDVVIRVADLEGAQH